MFWIVLGLAQKLSRDHSATLFEQHAPHSEKRTSADSLQLIGVVFIGDVIPICHIATNNWIFADSFESRWLPLKTAVTPYHQVVRGSAIRRKIFSSLQGTGKLASFYKHRLPEHATSSIFVHSAMPFHGGRIACDVRVVSIMDSLRSFLGGAGMHPRARSRLLTQIQQACFKTPEELDHQAKNQVFGSILWCVVTLFDFDSSLGFFESLLHFQMLGFKAMPGIPTMLGVWEKLGAGPGSVWICELDRCHSIKHCWTWALAVAESNQVTRCFAPFLCV